MLGQNAQISFLFVGSKPTWIAQRYFTRKVEFYGTSNLFKMQLMINDALKAYVCECTKDLSCEPNPRVDL